MIWNHTDSSELKMKNLDDSSLSKYLDKIKTETLLAYGVYQIEADARNSVHYIDLHSLFTDASGEYSRYLPDANGKLVDVRLSDGVHLSHWGGEWLSELLLSEISRLSDLGDPWGQ